MFGFGKNSPAQHVRRSQLLPLLEDGDQRAAAERFYPSPGRESFLTALRRLDPQSAAAIVAAGRQLECAAPLAEQPTVAIAGMLNSGKTSLVASFLSAEGKKLCLRGANNREGTHRFVLWLPSAWEQDSELWGLLLGRIGEALGSPPERLSSDPQQAHAQYNNSEGDASLLSVPLVATDPGLDAAGVGLLDCPDIVSDSSFGRGDPETRRQLLGKAATLCSAFLVVTTPEQFRDRDLADHLRVASDLMPGVPRLLAVNKIRPRQTPDQVWETFRPLAEQHRVEKIYAAYDFDIENSRPYIPAPPGEHDHRAVDASDPLPIFFSLAENPDENPPAAILDDRFLTELPGQLDRGKLFERFRIALETTLRAAVWEGGMDVIEEGAEKCQRDIERMRKLLLAVGLEFFANRQPGGQIIELRLHQSERIIRQLTDAFSASAPWYARWGVRMNAYVVKIVGGTKDLFRQIVPTAIARQKAGEVREALTAGEFGGILTPGRLDNALRQHGVVDRLVTQPDDSQLNQLSREAIARFERDDFTSLDVVRLDESVRRMWKEVPASKKISAGITPLTAALAAFGAVLLIPLDFGGSMIVASASIPELLAAAGLSAFATYWSGKQTTNNVGQQAARQQLSDFSTVLGDTLGIPRTDQPLSVQVAKQEVPLPAPTIKQRPAEWAPMTYWKTRQAFQTELNEQLPREAS
ncbi:hypothetical protein FF011L_18410 [Roseimaritima multifibrata]|uniref:Dynamin family protein n=1 Tax=Roseimaritima multifibrata TaxID=1930274 RepID=A0A517ME27_9BACT|nr:hypothetical protein [Roseimaritima multifibrata]QDS93086.1 hypothetical protein FF011L_18410 [Roseimaritima multifibrata]